MDTWQLISLASVAFLMWLYWLERNKRVQATSDLDQAVHEMALRSDLDERTGLLTSEAFEKALEEAAQRVDQAGGSCTVLAITLDNIGLIQDGFGDEFRS